MISSMSLWFRQHFYRLVNSIAFYPAIIAIGFLLASAAMIAFDFSDTGKELKSGLKWLSLKDADTARTIIAAIVAGVISLAVFSFSMVMVVLNQAASQMSNRVLDKLIGNRFQQIVLGIYIGTIMYALFLLSTIRDIDSGVSIPSLSTYLLILLTVIDIFIFIYFLHYITQSVKYDVIIQRIYHETRRSMEKHCCLKEDSRKISALDLPALIVADRSGIYEGFDKEALLAFCSKHDCSIELLHHPGTFVLEGISLLRSNKSFSGEETKTLVSILRISDTESINGNYLYGFRQLTEVAVKALSPGINDPGTAIVSLRTLFRLLQYRRENFPQLIIPDEKEVSRIFSHEPGFEQLFTQSIRPIWDYGKNDRMVQSEMNRLLTQLSAMMTEPVIVQLQEEVRGRVKSHEQNR